MVNRYGRAAMACGIAVLLAGCGSGSGAGTSSLSSSSSLSSLSSQPAAATGGTASTTPGSDFVGSPSVGADAGATDITAAAAAYCVDKGGTVQTRTADSGTNGDQQSWLALAGRTDLCRFQANDEAGSRIYVDLNTLDSAQPTLAGLAYLAKVPMPASAGGANPAAGYCSDLGGSSSFGSAGSSGGWVATDDPVDPVVSLCVFPDLSFIDEWGLAYHSNGDIRGADLATMMKYQPGATVPPVFVEETPTTTS